MYFIITCESIAFKKDVMPALCNKNLFTADGQPMKVCGTISLSINIKGLIVPLTFHVLERLTHNLILGINFLSQTKANIDLATRTVTFYDELVGLDIAKSNATLLRTTDAVLVPPRSEALVPVAVPSDFGSGLAIVEPAVNLNKKTFSFG